MNESQFWRKGPAWGKASRTICWLVRPSVFDLKIPDDHTIEYVLSDSEHDWGNHVPTPIARSIDREEIERLSIALYRQGRSHNLTTRWRDPDGNIVKKFEVIAKQNLRELTVIDLITDEERVARQLKLKERS